MPNLEHVVICVAGGLVLWALYIVLCIGWIAFITWRHFDPKEFYEKYDRASVEAMSERGGW